MTKPEQNLISGRPTVSLPGDIGRALRTHMFGVHTASGNFTMIAGTEGFRLAVPDQREFAAQHHDPSIEVMRVEIALLPWFMPSMHDLKAFSAQIAFECLTRE